MTRLHDLDQGQGTHSIFTPDIDEKREFVNEASVVDEIVSFTTGLDDQLYDYVTDFSDTD